MDSLLALFRKEGGPAGPGDLIAGQLLTAVPIALVKWALMGSISECTSKTKE